MKYRIFYIVILVILTITYLFWFYQYNFCTINMHLTSSIILFMPILLIILMYILSKKERLKYNIALGISISQIILFLILNFFTFIFVFVKEGTSYEENPVRYGYIYSIAAYKEYTYQFPKNISNELIENNNVQFYYSPQFLQAGFNLELLINMKNEEIDNYILKYENKVKEIINSENDKNLYSKYGIYKPYNVFKDKECDKFFDNCTIYLLESKPYKYNDWNHGYVSYMAKNEKLEELLLVTQVW